MDGEAAGDTCLRSSAVVLVLIVVCGSLRFTELTGNNELLEMSSVSFEDLPSTRVFRGVHCSEHGSQPVLIWPFASLMISGTLSTLPAAIAGGIPASAKAARSSSPILPTQPFATR